MGHALGVPVIDAAALLLPSAAVEGDERPLCEAAAADLDGAAGEGVPEPQEVPLADGEGVSRDEALTPPVAVGAADPVALLEAPVEGERGAE